ncbi:MAG: nucleotide exchange factor GrpE [Candidatus Methanospirareceae archaeon]
MSEEKRKGIKEKLERMMEEINSDARALEEESDKITSIKGEISGIKKELERRMDMMGKELSEEELEELEDAVEVLEAEVKEKRREVEEVLKRDVEKKAEEYLTHLKYLKADFENYKRRVEKEKKELVDYATERILMKLLDVVDNLDMAVAHAKKEDSEKGLEGKLENLTRGVSMILNQLLDILHAEGVEEMGAEGEKFDPFKHEIVSREVREDCEANTIIEVIRKGYLRRDKVMRPAMVKIAVKDEKQ